MGERRKKKHLCGIAIAIIFSVTTEVVPSAVFAAGNDIPATVAVWPGPAPGSESLPNLEHRSVEKFDPKVDTQYEFFSNVSVPTLVSFPANPARKTGAAVIICPGGAWVGLAWQFEGTDLARWLAARGVTAFVLKYRLRPTALKEPERSRQAKEIGEALSHSVPYYRSTVRIYADMAAADGVQAMKLVRHRAKEWGIDPAKIGMVGFSAGGDLVFHSIASSDPAAHPDFAASIYGVYVQRPGPGAKIPPLFVAVGGEDHQFVPLESQALADWTAAGQSIEFHIFSGGHHGFGMLHTGEDTDAWPSLFEAWLAHIGVIKE